MEILLELRKFAAPEIVFGTGACDLAGRHARNLGLRRPLLVSDPGVADAGWTGRVRRLLEAEGLACRMYTLISENPRADEIMNGAEVFADGGCDGIVAVGGGSPMDCAKGIGIVSVNGGHILDFEGVDRIPMPGPPLVCIPTTAGSSADVSQFAIVNDTDRKVKVTIVSKSLIPDAALIDPATTTTLPPEITANTGLDALTHAVEAYVSNAHSPMTDLLALEAVRRVRGHLYRTLEEPDDLNARGGMMLACMYAGMAFSNAILGAVHAMAHSLGGLLDLPHGLCNAVLLDHVAEWNFDAAPGRYVDVARALGGEISDDMPRDERKGAVVETIRAFKAELGVTKGLADLGVRHADIEKLAEFAYADPCLSTNPRIFTRDDLRALFRQAM